jgi:formylglycine-generating enzyme required for sulfatase activity
VASIAPVGFPASGAGNWGQLDLAGSVWEWNLDWYSPYVDPCDDCACLTAVTERVVRGGDFYLGESFLYPSVRGSNPPEYRGNDIGVRCARGL